MQVGNQVISREQMPSYISPQQQPYHAYQTMQDLLNQGLQVGSFQQQQVMPNTMEGQNSQWNAAPNKSANPNLNSNKIGVNAQ